MSFLRKLIALSLVAAPLAAQGPREKLVVSPQWLNAHLNDKNLVMIHIGEKPGYDSGHIAGARLIDMTSFLAPTVPGGPTLELPNPDTLRAGLARLGVSNDSRIVLYAAGNITRATRVLLTLDHAGLGDATLWLDGGLAAWKAAGFATTSDATPAAVGTLSPLKTKPVTVAAEFVRDNIGKPGIAVIDARASAFYDGLQEAGPADARRKGHIKGALSVPYTEITDAQGVLKSPADLQAVFTKAGVKPGDTIVGYCHIGQQATAMLFGARTLGYKVLLYDGSFEDWARRDWPLAVPPGK
jgi:thiosulfate/3-mercaptopyruvate sulfurtransferase